MRNTLIALSGLTIAVMAAIALIVASFAFILIHPWVMDGLGDSLEVLGDGSNQGWWYSFFREGWFLSYIPSLVFAALGFWLGAISIAVFRSKTK